MARTRAFAAAAPLLLLLLAARAAPPADVWLTSLARAGVLDVGQDSVDLVADATSDAVRALVGTAGRSTSQAESGDGNGGEGLRYEAASGNAQHLVVLMHGLSATVDQVSPLVPIAQLEGLQNTRFVVPQAPTAFVNYRQRTEPSWFNVEGTFRGAPEFEDEILAAVARVDAIIAAELGRGIPEGNVAVVGMSQGGAVCTTLYMRSAHKLSAAALLATWLPLEASYPASASATNADVPALMIHGEKDTVIELEWAQASARIMGEAGREVDFQSVADAPHVFDGQFLDVADTTIKYLFARGLD